MNAPPQNLLSLDHLTVSLTVTDFLAFFYSWSYGVLLWEMATLGKDT